MMPRIVCQVWLVTDGLQSQMIPLGFESLPLDALDPLPDRLRAKSAQKLGPLPATGATVRLDRGTHMTDQEHEHLRAIEANFYFFILDNDAMPPAYRPVLDDLYRAVAHAAGVPARDLPPHVRPPSKLATFLATVDGD